MEILRFKEEIANTSDKVVVLGNFDGIHKGHRFLIKKALEVGGKRKLHCSVLTFDKHPSFILEKSTPVQLILTRTEKEKAFELEGVEYYLEYPFSKGFASISPEAFVKDILVKKMNAKCVVVGSDYRFGHKRSGDTDKLIQLGKKCGMDVIISQKVFHDGKEISSTWIREVLNNGNITLANALMGRDFFYYGKVIKGKQIGRTLGFPTANIKPSPLKITLPFGVYASHVMLRGNGKKYKGITNIGVKPTVDGEDVLIETHILDFNDDIYGMDIMVSLIEFIREEKKFDNLEALKEQIYKDCQKVSKKF